jgi:hypothetical protein
VKKEAGAVDPLGWQGACGTRLHDEYDKSSQQLQRAEFLAHVHTDKQEHCRWSFN